MLSGVRNRDNRLPADHEHKYAHTTDEPRGTGLADVPLQPLRDRDIEEAERALADLSAFTAKRLTAKTQASRVQTQFSTGRDPMRFWNASARLFATTG